MHVSPAGRAMIERFEGCRLTAYKDIVGVWTIGYGCTGPAVHVGEMITQAQADDMLSTRLANEFEPGVLKAFGNAPTTQGQFDAMVSLAFNIGVHGFAGSSVARLHKLGKYDEAADAFLLWDKAGGRVVEALSRRRAEEGQMYLDASPTSCHTDPL